jgi:mannonate dehydratase
LLGKLFHTHFRNIRGGLHDFQEVWPDEGDVDMLELTAALYDNGYEYMLDPDHAPDSPEDPDTSPRGVVAASNPYVNGSGRVRQSYAFEFGYVIALIQAVKKSRGHSWSEIRTPQPKPKL